MRQQPHICPCHALLPAQFPVVAPHQQRCLRFEDGHPADPTPPSEQTSFRELKTDIEEAKERLGETEVKLVEVRARPPSHSWLT